MGYQNSKDPVQIMSGGAGNPNAFDIIEGGVNEDLGGNIVTAFISLDTAGGTFTAMEEETTIGHGGKVGASEPMAAKYLTYTYPYNMFFPGRFTKLTPAAGCKFQVFFLK